MWEIESERKRRERKRDSLGDNIHSQSVGVGGRRMGERARRAENKRRDGMREWQLYECAHIPHVMLLLNEITGNSPDEVPYGGVRLGVFPPLRFQRG